MLYRVTFINNNNINKSFIVSAKSKDNCKRLAKNYIKESGGTKEIINMKLIKSLGY